MSLTLNSLIEAAVTGGQAAEEAETTTVKVASAASAAPASADPVNGDEIEKLADALEFMAKKGLASLLEPEKTAMVKCPGCGAKCDSCKGDKCTCCKKCAAMRKKAGVGLPSGTNDGPPKKETKKSQVGPHKGAPSMKEPGYGSMETNDKKKPGGSAGSPDTSDKEKGTHHSALKSNESAIAYDKKEKAKRVSPALDSLLDAKPFADPKLKESLSGDRCDKNIHSKSAHDLSAVHAELAKRVAAGRA